MRRSLSILFWFLFFFVLAAFVGGVGSFEKWRQMPVTATLEADSVSGPRDALVVDFSKPIRAESLAGKVALSPAIPIKIEWHDFGKRLVITPETNWALDTEYRLTIGPGRTTWFSRTPPLAFTVASPLRPKVVSITPSDGMTDVVLGIEDPIRVTFDRSIKDFYIDFQFDPAMAVVYRNNPEKTVFEILPGTELRPDTTYRLSLRFRWRDEADTAYQPLGHTTFATLPPKPQTVSRDYAIRVADAKRFTRARQSDGKYIDINLATQVMTLFEDGHALDAYMISSGKQGMETPRGQFAIRNKALRPWSKAYSLYMPYWQAITPDGKYGIHELPEWPGGYKEGANHLGTPVSHGCMRLGIGPARRVYEWAPIGTPVIVY